MLTEVKKHLTPKQILADAEFFFLLNLGLVATAAGIALFKTPNHFAFGGTSGLSIVLATLFPRFNVGAFMWVVNAVLVVLGFIFLGIRSMGWTIYSSFALSFYVSAFEWAVPLRAPLTNDVFLELCYAVILSAVGAAIVFNIGASTGGTDIVAMILNKYTSMPVGRALMVSDLGIVLAGAYLYGPATGLYCILGMILKSTVADSAIEGINLRKVCTVVTSQPEPVRDFIVNKLHRSATMEQAQALLLPKVEELKARFTKAMDNDLNTSMAVTVLYDVLKARTTDATKLAALDSFDQVLGLKLTEKAASLRKTQAAAPAAGGFTVVCEDGGQDPQVEALIRARADAKKAKNFAEADRIRDELKTQGVEITDVPGGVRWKRA